MHTHTHSFILTQQSTSATTLPLLGRTTLLSFSSISLQIQPSKLENSWFIERDLLISFHNHSRFIKNHQGKVICAGIQGYWRCSCSQFCFLLHFLACLRGKPNFLCIFFNHHHVILLLLLPPSRKRLGGAVSNIIGTRTLWALGVWGNPLAFERSFLCFLHLSSCLCDFS